MNILKTLLLPFVSIFQLFTRKNHVTDSDKLIGFQESIEVRIENKRNTIINDSVNKLINLKSLVDFFDDEILFDIYEQSIFIHDIFVNDINLNINNLEQFHSYYTVHIFDILEKLKDTRNKNVLYLNNKIEKLNKNIKTYSDKIENKKILKNSNINNYTKITEMQLNAIHNCLIDNFDDFRYKDLYFYPKFRDYSDIDSWYITPTPIYKQLINVLNKDLNSIINIEKHYKDFRIDQDLLKILNNNRYNFTTVCGFIHMDDSFVLFNINNSEYFIYHENLCYFRLLNKNEYILLEKLIKSNHTNYFDYNIKITEYTQELINSKTKLKSAKYIQHDVKETFKKYLNKIETTILNVKNEENINIEKQILDSILSLERIEL